MKKCLAVGIILLFVGTCIIQAIAYDTEKPLLTSRGKWLYVGGGGPGNYSTIQGAINNASDGDTVFVYDDSSPYIENVMINKAIHLFGENQNTTVIEAYVYLNYAIRVFADNVMISSFTIRAGAHGIDIETLQNITIVSNTIIENGIGVHIKSSSNISILENIFYSNPTIIVSIENSSNCKIHSNDVTAGRRTVGKTIGPTGPPVELGNCSNSSIYGNIFKEGDELSSYMMCDSCCDNIISTNIFTGAYICIDLMSSNRNTICNNSLNGVYQYGTGISLVESSYNFIKNNYIGPVSDGNGIMFNSSHHNIITGNTIGGNYSDNYYDFYLSSSYNNIIYYNNFMDSGYAFDNGINKWNTEYPSAGNHWSNYNGVDHLSGPDQNESGPDGIGDTPNNIPGGSNEDRYPLMLPLGITTLSIEFIPRPFISSISIMNIGSATALNVQWQLTLKGGFLFCKRDYAGITKPLLPSTKITLSPKFFLFGFGPIEITLTSWADNAPKVTKNINGFLLLFFFFNS